MGIKNLIRNLIPARLKLFLTYSEEVEYQRISFSQFGEDLLINDIINKDKGFYIDVGAFHPIQSSNTYFFYKKGWNGINIEPRVGSKELFDKYRPKDINLECGISDVQGKLKYKSFSEGRYNRMEEADDNLGNSDNSYNINVKTLESILNEVLTSQTQIDFISIDVEGMELKVLKSLDINKYKPELIVVEDHSFSIEKKSETYSYLINKGYELKAIGINSLFYQTKF